MVSVISLWQPWASLINPHPCAKTIETRSWPAPESLIGQPIAIHATKRPMGEEEILLCIESPFREAMFDIGAEYPWDERDPDGVPWPDSIPNLPYGALLSVALLAACVRVPSGAAHVVRTVEHPDGITVPPPEPERSFGDYTPSRFAWVLSDIRLLPRPIPAKGSQGIWQTAEPEVCRLAAEIRARHLASLPKQEVLF